VRARLRLIRHGESVQSRHGGTDPGLSVLGARQALELPELDRLYGELAKLEALASRDNDAEVLAARQAQAHTVATLKPWKLLLK